MGRMRSPFAASLAFCAVILAGWFGSSPARADPSPSEHGVPSDSASASPPATEFHWRAGPLTLDLGHDIALALPERHAFLGGAEAAKLLEKNGSFHNEDLLGLVVGRSENEKWFVTIRYDEEGYVKDTESINADELLTAIKDGTEEANEEREAAARRLTAVPAMGPA